MYRSRTEKAIESYVAFFGPVSVQVYTDEWNNYTSLEKIPDFPYVSGQLPVPSWSLASQPCVAGRSTLLSLYPKQISFQNHQPKTKHVRDTV